MIDIHTHILPGVDDGPDTMDEALDIIRMASNDGVKGMVSTSHILHKIDDEIHAKYQSVFNELKLQVLQENLPMDLWLASEIHLHSQFDLKYDLMTFNQNKKYLLFELPMHDVPADTGDLLFNMSIEGITPILAHPARNTRIRQNLQKAYDLVERGVLMQLNAGSLTGNFGKQVKKIAFKMLDHQMVHFVASDCHGTHRRTPILSEAYRVVEKNWGKDTADLLFKENPLKAVKAEAIFAGYPIPLNQKPKGIRKSKKWILF